MNSLANFESARVLIDAGTEAIDSFATNCSLFLQDSRYEIVRSKEAVTGDILLSYRFQNKMPPRLREAAGSIVVNFRNALDHAVCDAAVILGRSNKKGLHFPFCRLPDGINRRIKDACGGVRAELVQILRDTRPYQGGDDLLYLVNDLANRHKHQTLLDISLDPEGWILDGSKMSEMRGPISLGSLKWVQQRNELIFLRVGPGGSMGGDFDLYAKPAFRIVFREEAVKVAGDAAEVLRKLSQKVSEIVDVIETATLKIADPR